MNDPMTELSVQQVINDLGSLHESSKHQKDQKMEKNDMDDHYKSFNHSYPIW